MVCYLHSIKRDTKIRGYRKALWGGIKENDGGREFNYNTL
jgi:hypothetical protein